MSLTLRVPAALRPARAAHGGALVPPDPREALDGPLDPALDAIRSSLAPHRRRLWLRRIVRRGWMALAAIAVGEVAVWTIARFMPLEAAPLVAATIPAVVLLAWLAACILARPSLGETALAVDVEGGLGDRVSSALELAVAFPGSATPPADGVDLDAPVAAVDEAAETDRFVRRQRRDALQSLRTVPALFKPRFSRNPAIAAMAAVALLVPVVALPNPQNAVIAERQEVREAADRQADRLEEIARDLETRGRDAEDPRTRLAEELRELARQLRDRPGELAANLRQLGAVESDVRARIDPATEQRASAMTSLARSLSRAATGDPDANRDGEPERTRDDLKELGDKLDGMTEAERRALAQQLAEMQSTASSADGGAATALRDAAQSLAQGDPAGARSALDRLGESMAGAQANIDTNRDLAEAASRLQDARRDLADAGQPGDQQGQGQGGPRARAGAGQPAAQRSGSGSRPRSRSRSRPRAGARSGSRPRAGPRARARARSGSRPRAGPRARARSGSGPRPRARSGRHRRRRVERPLARPGHWRQRPPCRADQPEPAFRAR